MSVRRNANGDILPTQSLAEYCEIRRLELARFEAWVVQQARKAMIEVPDVAFDLWDEKFERFCATVPAGIRVRRAGDGER